MQHAPTSPASKTAYQESTHASATSNARGSIAVNQQVGDTGAKSDARLALLFAGGALALSFAMLILVYGLYNRYYVMRIYYDDIKAALLQHGVNPHPHLPTESP